MLIHETRSGAAAGSRTTGCARCWVSTFTPSGGVSTGWSGRNGSASTFATGCGPWMTFGCWAPCRRPTSPLCGACFHSARLHGQWPRFIIGETAGTSGEPCATAYRDDEFHAAFITPFLRVAEATGFPAASPGCGWARPDRTLSARSCASWRVRRAAWIRSASISTRVGQTAERWIDRPRALSRSCHQPGNRRDAPRGGWCSFHYASGPGCPGRSV